MTAIAVQAVPEQKPPLSWQVVPSGHGADPSVSHRWAHIPPMMHTSPGEQAPASIPHLCVLAEQAIRAERRATQAAAISRRMG